MINAKSTRTIKLTDNIYLVIANDEKIKTIQEVAAENMLLSKISKLIDGMGSIKQMLEDGQEEDERTEIATMAKNNNAKPATFEITPYFQKGKQMTLDQSKEFLNAVTKLNKEELAKFAKKYGYAGITDIGQRIHYTQWKLRNNGR